MAGHSSSTSQLISDLPVTKEQESMMRDLGVFKYKGLDMYNDDQNTEEWFEARNCRITASNAAQAIGASSRGSAADLVKTKIYGCTPTAAMIKGLELEPKIAQEYIEFEKMRGVDVTLQKRGLMLHPECPWIGASLDYERVAPDSAIIEIKYSSRIPEGLKLPIDTEYQVITQLAIYAANHPEIQAKAVVFYATDTDVGVYNLDFDKVLEKKWTRKILPQLHNYYMRQLLPKLHAHWSKARSQQSLRQASSVPLPPVCLAPTNSREQQQDKALPQVEQSPALSIKKRVFVVNQGKFGTVKNLRKPNADLCGKFEEVVVEYDGEELKRERYMDSNFVRVLPIQSKMVPPTAVGQRVIVNGGEYTRKYGIITSFSMTMCTVQLMNKVKISVDYRFLHAWEMEGTETAPCTVPVKSGFYKIKVNEVHDFLENYKTDFNTDLVLKRVNDSCSWDMFKAILDEKIPKMAPTDTCAGGVELPNCAPMLID